MKWTWKHYFIKIARVFIWILLWQVIAMMIHNRVEFAGPITTIQRLIWLGKKAIFWNAIWNTFSGIALGFVVAMVVGTLLGYFSYYIKLVDVILSPMVEFFQYIPMIAFTIMSIIWFRESRVTFFVSLFLAMPLIYRHTLSGLRGSNQKYLKGIWKRKLSIGKRLVYLYQPISMPEYITGCTRGLNACWKSGIVAQVLVGGGVYNIGTALNTARIDEDMGSVFCWTIVIVFLSKMFEFVVIFLLRQVSSHSTRNQWNKIHHELQQEDTSL